MVRWSNGVAVRSDQTKLLFDPIDSDPSIPDLFITHAHYDHTKGFQFPVQKKHSTSETRELYELDTGRQVGNWEQIRKGRRIQLGNLEVEAHDAGHVLGSVHFEITTREENLVYASHLNFVDTLTSRAAEVPPCDTLIIEASFSPSYQTLPSRESVTADIVKWALECVREHRVPTFATDALGTAQELVKVFNSWTELPVVVHPRIARLNQAYSNNGVTLTYFDAGSENARAIIEDGKCVVVIPRRFDAGRYGEFRVAHVTAWPTQAERAAGKVFLLSDQADLQQLLEFVKEARPKTVLAFRGGSKVLTELVSKRFHIACRILSTDVRPAQPRTSAADEEKLGMCEDYILGLVQVPDLTYGRGEITSRALNEGFTLEVIEEALSRLTQKNLLRYSKLTEGYSLIKP